MSRAAGGSGRGFVTYQLQKVIRGGSKGNTQGIFYNTTKEHQWTIYESVLENTCNSILIMIMRVSY